MTLGSVGITFQHDQGLEIIKVLINKQTILNFLSTMFTLLRGWGKV